MKVGIIAANNIRYSPYIFYYTKLFDANGIDYEIIFPNRSGLSDTYSGVVHETAWVNGIPTSIAYYHYSSVIKRKIKEYNYDFLIILTTNNAVYLARWLKKYYRYRYIVDIRDYTHENLLPYYYLETVAVRNSVVNVISSSRFVRFLPKARYLICHNNINTEAKIPVNKKCNNEKLIIGYIGKGAYIDQCKRMCDLIKHDNRYEFHVYGMPEVPQSLKQYERTANVKFMGVFSPDEKPEIIESVDILFNVYGNGSPLLDYALSNKLYDSLVYKKPILTSSGTYMSEMAGPLSFDVDFDESYMLDKLYNWYCNLNHREIEEYSERIIKTINEENKKTEMSILDAIKKSMDA